jgi:predicted RNA binding protein YcfA (HicA-like mRNA interferase family)
LGKLRAVSGQEICKILSSHGPEIERQRGSHVVTQKKSETSAITIPVSNHKEI